MYSLGTVMVFKFIVSFAKNQDFCDVTPSQLVNSYHVLNDCTAFIFWIMQSKKSGLLGLPDVEKNAQ